MSVNELIELSRYFGNNPDFILGGGGNTSWKDSSTIYVKNSGFSLSQVTPESFVEMDRKALNLIFEKTYSGLNAERESLVLADMMAAKKAGQEHKRPSVETLLHNNMPFSFVVHLHPAVVNGLTCSVQGERAMTEIFGDEAMQSIAAVWIPSANPGFMLAKTVKTAMDTYNTRLNKQVQIIFLQNHGVFVGADSSEEVKKIYNEIVSKISAKIKRQPDFSDEKYIPCEKWPAFAANAEETVGVIYGTLTQLAGCVSFMQSSEIASFIKDRPSFEPVSSAFSPDHIVYAGCKPLWTENRAAQGLRSDWESYSRLKGKPPKVVAVKGLGVFGAAAIAKAANLALELFKDAVKVAVFSESFGGHRFMPDDQIDFISNWEAERFRLLTN